jgi:four helix bundle protein
MTIKTFRDIIAWQKAHELTLLVYSLTEKYPCHEIFGLTNQSRRCAVSVPSNIAEGFKRASKNDSVHFYIIAQGSLEELKYQLLLAKDLKYYQHAV